MNGDRGNARTRAEHMNNRRVKPRLHEAKKSSVRFSYVKKKKRCARGGRGGEMRDNLSRVLHVTRNRTIDTVRRERLGVFAPDPRIADLRDRMCAAVVAQLQKICVKLSFPRYASQIFLLISTRCVLENYINIICNKINTKL